MADFQIGRARASIPNGFGVIVPTPAFANAPTAILMPATLSQDGLYTRTNSPGALDSPRDINTVVGKLLGILPIFARAPFEDTPGNPKLGDVETWEYIGAPGGPNEFILRAENKLVTAAATVTGPAITTATDLSRVVPMAVTSRSQNAGFSTQHPGAFMWTAELVGNVPTYVRLGAFDTAQVIGQWVEFTGSNWSVHKFTHQLTNGMGSPNTITIPDVGSWSNAFIIVQLRRGESDMDADERSVMVYPGPSTTQVNILPLNSEGPGSFGPAFVTVAVISNPTISVQHIGSTTGETELVGLSESAAPSVLTRTFTEVGAMETTGLIVTGVHESENLSPDHAQWNYRLIDTETIEFRRNGGSSDVGLQRMFWHAQVIDFDPDLIVAPTTPTEPCVVAGSGPTPATPGLSPSTVPGASGIVVPPKGAASVPKAGPVVVPPSKCP